MPQKKHNPEEFVAKLRQVAVFHRFASGGDAILARIQKADSGRFDCV
jgi:hypothetical protein